ncbi:hypothetical protein EK21DRAFT_116534 [Setomelanomma holmii]|uniref:Uncharacterized protein n=1 Tax=Setomelanomma holmii TaxID=210430 RepID=A0A9P4H181_9PLEO|nr:hypothetical protein EK21DRAFT_116534 [Setomelanomma holmii]
MAYSRVRDDSPRAIAHGGKEAPESWESREESRSFHYRTFLGLTLALWLATSAALLWALAPKTKAHQNHQVNSLPFSIVPSHDTTFADDARFHYAAKDGSISAW